VLVAKLSIVHQLTTSSMPTLSAFGSQFYFPPHNAPDYPTLAVGLLLAGAGVVLLLASAILTFSRRRAE
jgi:hypothetical protein